MEQFSLEKYLKNPDRQIVTRDGRSARIVCTNRMDDDYPVIVLIREGNNEVAECYTKDGEYYKNNNCSHDLFFAPEKKEGWINVYRIETVDAREITVAGSVYPTKEEALAGKSDAVYVDTIKIQWEE